MSVKRTGEWTRAEAKKEVRRAMFPGEGDFYGQKKRRGRPGGGRKVRVSRRW